MTDQTGEELGPSDLGTLEFWEKVYSDELDNFKDHGDVGEVWFGRKNSLKVVRWICSNQDLIKSTDKIIDIGCGNGMMLVELAKKGFVDLTGVDYSQKAVDLAEAILKENHVPNVTVTVCDILDLDTAKFPAIFKVAHDKGTYDAISLHPEERAAKRQKYFESVYNILSPGGYLILTSCNWTKEELLKHLESNFELADELPADTFQFGGQTGNTVTQLIFRKA